MMKKQKLLSIAIFTLALSGKALAVNPGFFFGLQAGYANTNNKTATVQTGGGNSAQVNPSNTGAAARIFLGYNFNPYAAWEFGYSHYPASTYNAPNTSGNNPAIREGGIDIVGKGIYPFGTSGFGIYGKGGIAVIRTSTSASITNSNNTNSKGSTTNSVRPTLSVGVSYDISQNWVADLSYNQVIAGGSVKSISFVALGISYHFVNLMCGQFLC